MKIKLLSVLLVSGLFALTSCTKDAMMSDSQLIQAIQKASKQEVDATQLPAPATTVLSDELADYYNARTLLASELGYEARMTEGERPDDGSEGDEYDDRRRRYWYFDLNGRPLGERPDDGSEDGDDDRPDDGSEDGDDDRPDDGSEDDGDEDRPDDGSEDDGDEDRPDDGSEDDGDEDRPDDGSEEDGDEDRPDDGVEEADDTDRG